MDPRPPLRDGPDGPGSDCSSSVTLLARLTVSVLLLLAVYLPVDLAGPPPPGLARPAVTAALSLPLHLSRVLGRPGRQHAGLVAAVVPPGQGPLVAWRARRLGGRLPEADVVRGPGGSSAMTSRLCSGQTELIRSRGLAPGAPSRRCA